MAWWRKPSAQPPQWSLEDYHTAFVALHLSVAHPAKGYRDNRRATATEIQALGGQVRPGEQDHAQARSPLVRVDDVFHVEQVDGLTLVRRDDDRDQEPKWKTHRTAERMIQESGVHVRHERGDRAFYNMQTDTVIGEVHHQVKLTESAAPDWRMIPARGHDAGVAMFEAVGSGKTAACMPPFAPHRRRTPLSGSPCPEETIAPERPHRRGGRRATSPPRRGQASTILGGGSLRALWKVYPSRPGGDAAREHSLAPAEGSTGPSPAEPGRSCP